MVARRARFSVWEVLAGLGRLGLQRVGDVEGVGAWLALERLLDFAVDGG